MSKAFGGTKSGHLGTIIVDKLSYAVVFFTFLGFSLAFALIFVPLPLPYRIAMATILVFGLGAVVSGFLLHTQLAKRSRVLRKALPVVYNWPLMRLVRSRFPSYQHFEEYCITRLENVWRPVASAISSPGVLAMVLCVGAGSWLTMCAANYVLFRALGAELGFGHVVIMLTIATFLGDVSVSPGGAGFTEAAMVALCAGFGVDYGTAVAATLVSRGVYYGFTFGGGGVSLAVLALRYGRSSREPAATVTAAPAGTPQEPLDTLP
jgi:uncharacterized protein (TIRG00374 family)